MASDPDEQRRLTEERVASLDDSGFQFFVDYTRRQLELSGHAFVDFSPGDATRYLVTIVKPHDEFTPGGNYAGLRPGKFTDAYHVASNYGPVYQWSPAQGDVDPTYVLEKWVGNRNYHTACVLARFLNTLADHINREETEPDEAPQDT